MRTKLISAYPCLGKTTLSRSDLNSYLDFQIESNQSLMSMPHSKIASYYDSYVNILECLLSSGQYRAIFIPADDFILLRLVSIIDPSSIQIAIPDLISETSIKAYRQRVVGLKGFDYWSSRLENQINSIDDKISQFRKIGFDVRIVESDNYLIDVVSLFDFKF